MASDRSQDDDLLARYRKADFHGFDLFYRRNHELIFRFLLSRLGDRADAEEALQETFLRIHRGIASYDPAQRALPWVITIARNVALDAVRRTRRRRLEAAADAADAVTEAVAETSLIASEELDRLTSHLTADERSLLRQRIVDDDDFATIARRSGTSEAGARQRLSRILRKLKA